MPFPDCWRYRPGVARTCHKARPPRFRACRGDKPSCNRASCHRPRIKCHPNVELAQTLPVEPAPAAVPAAESSALPQAELAQTSPEPAPASDAPNVVSEPSVAMRTKHALLRGLALREANKKQQEPGEKGFAPNPVATPARSNTPPPIPGPVVTPTCSNTPPPVPTTAKVVGSEDDVQAVAEMLASAGNSDDEAGDATQHYETEYVFEDSQSEGEADHDDGVSVSIRHSSEEEGQPFLASEPETGKEDLWLAEAEVARRFGRPAGWGQEASAFLSPEMQEEPKPRGRKPGKGINKRKGASKAGEPCTEVALRAHVVARSERQGQLWMKVSPMLHRPQAGARSEHQGQLWMMVTNPTHVVVRSEL